MTKSPFIYWCLKDIKLDLGQPNQNKLFPELLNLSLWVRMKCFANVSPAQKHHNRVSFSRDEAEQEDITAAAVIALQNRLSQRSVLMQRHLLTFGPHQVVHNMTEKTNVTKIIILRFNNALVNQINGLVDSPARGVTAAIAEPFLAGVAIDHTCWIMDATVAANIRNKNQPPQKNYNYLHTIPFKIWSQYDLLKFPSIFC